MGLISAYGSSDSLLDIKNNIADVYLYKLLSDEYLIEHHDHTITRSVITTTSIDSTTNTQQTLTLQIICKNDWQYFAVWCRKREVMACIRKQVIVSSDGLWWPSCIDIYTMNDQNDYKTWAQLIY